MFIVPVVIQIWFIVMAKALWVRNVSVVASASAYFS